MNELPKDVVNQILDELRPERQQPGDVTVRMAKEDWGVSKSKARDILERAVDAGNLIKIYNVIQDSGKSGVVYRKVL